MIPEQDGESLCDITVHSTDKDAVEISQQLIDRCTQNGIDPKKANAVGLAAEELTVNIARYGYNGIKPGYIDINLSKADDRLLLRVRDDGVPFNPTEYTAGDDGEFLLGGIAVIKAVAEKMTYTRVLNMNNTVIEVLL